MLVDKMIRWLDALPRSCLLCTSLHRNRGPLCGACEQSMPENNTPCLLCAEPQAMAGQLCARCQKKAPPYERAVAPWRYEEAVMKLIHRFKFQGDLRAATALLPALQQACSTLPVEALIPVPIHDQRHRERGFNQALWLADRLAGLHGWPVMEVLHKTRHTADQVGLSRSQRQRNLRGALQLQGSGLPQSVAVVDDVLSSGATAEACTRLLHRAGCSRVYVLALARTPRKTG